MGITIDVLESVRENLIRLFLSGDGDFALLLKKLRNRMEYCRSLWCSSLTSQSLIDASSFHLSSMNFCLLELDSIDLLAEADNESFKKQ